VEGICLEAAQQIASANPAIALRLQSARLVAAVAEVGALGVNTRTAMQAQEFLQHNFIWLVLFCLVWVVVVFAWHYFRHKRTGIVFLLAIGFTIIALVVSAVVVLLVLGLGFTHI